MSHSPVNDRKLVTRTFLAKIKAEARRCARSGESYQAALERLSLSAGYTGGWTELSRLAGMVLSASKKAANGKSSPNQSHCTLDQIPIWDRSIEELLAWFERPFASDTLSDEKSSILCLDGREWNCATVVSEWESPSQRQKAIEEAKNNYAAFLANSKWILRPYHVGDGRWSVHLQWLRPGFFRYRDEELLFIATDKAEALKRERLLCDIRQHRIRNFDKLFQLCFL